MLHSKYNGVGPCDFRQDFFYIFCKKNKIKHVIPRAGLFLTKGHNLNKLGKVALGDATTEYCFMLSLLSLCKTCDPQDGSILATWAYF